MSNGLDDAFIRAVAAIDDAWALARELSKPAMRARVDTLSTSLADPQAHDVEMILSAARIGTSAPQRDALIAIACACHAQGLITQAAAERLVGEFRRT